VCEETKIRFVPTSGKCAMHYSAKRGFAIACRLSVRPSVTLVDYDHISWSVWDIRSQIAAEWLQIAQLRSQWRAYRKPPSLFRMVPSLIPYDLPFPPNGGSICPKIREWSYLRNGWSDTLHVLFYGRVFRVGGSNGAISGYIKSQLVAGPHLG